MNQAVTRVNDGGPVILVVIEVDVAHEYGRQQSYSRKRQVGKTSIGVLDDGMVQDGLFVNLGDLHNSACVKQEQYVETSLKGQGLTKSYAEVGLGDITQREEVTEPMELVSIDNV